MSRQGPSPLLSFAGEVAPAGLLDDLKAAGREVRASGGSQIVFAGATDRDAILLLEGTLRVELLGVDGRVLVVRTVEPVHLLGELAAIDGRPRSATLAALTDCRLFRIPPARFRAAILGSAEGSAWLAGHLVHLVRSLTQQLYALSFLSAKARLHCELLRLARIAGISGNAAVVLNTPIHEELAQRIGSHREAVSREMAALTRAGILKQARRRLVILDLRSLEALVQEALGASATDPEPII